MINCVVEYKNLPHLFQLYNGFRLLEQRGVIKLRFEKSSDDLLKNKPVIKVVINDMYVLYYDTLDGFNWLDSSLKENLSFFNNNFVCDYYYKRSYSSQLSELIGSSFEVLPLGLYYNIPYSRGGLINNLKNKIRNNSFVNKKLKINAFLNVGSFENYPDLKSSNSILFSARLWDPSLAKTKESRLNRQAINDFRISLVTKLEKKYGKKFIGGIAKDKYSSTVLDDKYLLPFEFTNREYYIKQMKNTSICVATTGLHNSIGGKFAEYVAASRAILTEPLHYDVPGDFKNEQNYLEFSSETDLICKIDYLLNSKVALENMMMENYKYYHLNMRPDIIIYNTISNVLK